MGFFVSYFERRSLVPIDDYGWCIARAIDDTTPHYTIPPGASVNVLYAEWTDEFSAATEESEKESELPPPPELSDANAKIFRLLRERLSRSREKTPQGNPDMPADDAASDATTVVGLDKSGLTRRGSAHLYEDTDGSVSDKSVVTVLDNPRSPIEPGVEDMTYPISVLESAQNVNIVKGNIGRRRKDPKPKYVTFRTASEVMAAFKRLAPMEEFEKRVGFTDRSDGPEGDVKASLKRADVAVRSVQDTIFAAQDKGGDAEANRVYREFILPLVNLKLTTGDSPTGYRASGRVTARFSKEQRIAWNPEMPFQTWRKIYELWRQRTTLQTLTDEQLANLPDILAVFISEARCFKKGPNEFQHLVPENTGFANYTMIVPMNTGGITKKLYQECEEDKLGSAVGHVQDKGFWVTPRHLHYTRKDGAEIEIPIMGPDSVCFGVGKGVSVTHEDHQYDWVADVGVVYQSPSGYTTNLNEREVRWYLDATGFVNMTYPLKKNEIGNEVTIDLKSYDGGDNVIISDARPGNTVKVDGRGAHKYLSRLGVLERQELTVNFVRYRESA
jgi:hypothetical protein